MALNNISSNGAFITKYNPTGIDTKCETEDLQKRLKDNGIYGLNEGETVIASIDSKGMNNKHGDICIVYKENGQLYWNPFRGEKATREIGSQFQPWRFNYATFFVPDNQQQMNDIKDAALTHKGSLHRCYRDFKNSLGIRDDLHANTNKGLRSAKDFANIVAKEHPDIITALQLTPVKPDKNIPTTGSNTDQYVPSTTVSNPNWSIPDRLPPETNDEDGADLDAVIDIPDIFAKPAISNIPLDPPAEDTSATDIPPTNTTASIIEPSTTTPPVEKSTPTLVRQINGFFGVVKAVTNALTA